MKKLVSLILVLTMLLVAACSAEELVNSPDAKPLEIGVIIWSTDDALSASVKSVLDYAGTVLDCNFTYDVGSFSAEAQIAATENFCAAGVDGILAVPLAEPTKLSMVQVCAENNVPISFMFRSLPTDGSADAVVELNTLVGYQTGDEITDAYTILKRALEEGYTKIGLIHQVPGNSSGQPRWDGFDKAMAEFGLEYVMDYQVPVTNTGVDYVTGAENILALYPDTEIMLMTGGASGGLEGICALIEQMGSDCKIICFDNTNDMSGFETGTYYGLACPSYNVAFMSFIALYNHIQGAPLNGDAAGVEIPVKTFFIYDAEEAAVADKYMINGLPYSAEEIWNMSALNNPEFNIDAFNAIQESFSLKDVAARMG